MKNRNARKHLIAAVLGMAVLFPAGSAFADVIVDPKGHDPVRLEQDIMECRNLAGSVDFNMAKEHQGRAVARGAVIGGGFAAIGGGGKEVRRRSAAAGAFAGGISKNKAKRVDGSVEDAKRREVQRNCLAGRGYNPIS